MSQQDAADVVALHTRLLDAVGQSVVATDPSGRVMYWNHAATALFGYSAAEAVGRHIGSLVLRVADEMDAAAIVAAVLGGNVRAGEFALRRKDGAVIPVWVTDAPIRDTAGDVVGIVSVSTDLTEVRQADHRIRALTAALEGIDEAVLVIDVETARISECNARAESLLGVDRSDLVGRHITEFANEEMGDQQREHMATLAAGQALPLTRTVRQRPDGTPVNLLVSITPVVDRRGVVTAGAVVLRDGDLAGEPATLRLTDDDVRRDFAEAMIPQASIDVHGNFVEVNAAMADFLRYAARALIGAPADDVYHPDERHAARNGRAALLRGDIRRLTANRRYVASDGSTLYGIARYVVVNDEHGHPDHVTVLIDDVTDVHSATDALVHAEARFRSLSHRSSDIVFVSDKDAVISYVSAAITPQYGYTSEALVGLSGFELLHPDDTETAFRAFVVAASHTVDMPPIRARMRRSDGSYVRSEITFSNLLEDPVVNGMVVNIRDITTTVRAEEDMRASDRRYRTLLESARDGVVMTDDHGIITFASERAAEILRAEVDQLVGSLGASWLLVDDAWVETARSSRIDSTHVHRYEVRAKRGDGTLGWLHVSAAPQLNSDGEITGVQAVIADISEKRAAQEELARLALHDPLTGLANRTLLSDRLRRALSLAGVAAGRPVLLHVDIDDFKRVNDSLGHVLGDEALRTIADRLRSAIGAADTVARDSGDGFLILIEDLPFADTAIKTAERIRESLRAQLLVGTHRLSVTATVGVAIADGRDAEALIGAADSAVSLGKERGGDQVSLFDEKVHSATLAEWALAGDLEGAVERDEISLHFQPVVNLMSGRAVGAEALMRWRHPVRGNVPPDAFIPVAERSKLIIELGGFALRGACAAAAAWLASGAVPAGFVMAVNLSARELADVDLFDRVSVILSDTGLPPESLCLEVTETAVMTDAAVAYRTLKRLNDAGVHLSIDDFGTGYSSLVYLKRLPVQQLKVDRMFVAGLGTDPDDTAIVASVIGLADAVGISCVAEGVETQEQAHALRRLGCRYAQGYLFGRPVPGDELLAALRSIDATAAAL